jgi:DNA-binding GntR family transcriptional regulator
MGRLGERKTVVNQSSTSKLEGILRLRVFLERHCAQPAAQRLRR